jgi:hypothetical protein
MGLCKLARSFFKKTKGCAFAPTSPTAESRDLQVSIRPREEIPVGLYIVYQTFWLASRVFSLNGIFSY